MNLKNIPTVAGIGSSRTALRALRCLVVLCLMAYLGTMLSGCGSSGCGSEQTGDDDIVITELKPVIQIEVEGTAPATLVDFGQVNVGFYLTKEFAIQNVGQATLHLSSVALKTGAPSSTAANYFEITQSPGSEVPAGGEVMVRVKFWAYEYNSEGTTDVVVIQSDDEKNSEIQVGLQAVVVKPQVQVSPSQLNFPNVSTESSKTQTLTIQNTGDGLLQLLDLSFDPGMTGFSVKLPTSYSYGQPIEPGIGVNVEITFAPEDETTVSGNLTVLTNDPDTSRVTVPITANGQEEEPPVVDIIAPENDESFYTGSTILLQAKVSDANEPPENLQLFWSTSEGVACSGVAASESGTVTCTAKVQTVGVQTITLVALDSTGKTGVDIVEITVWDEETPLNYVISGDASTSLYAFTADDNIQVWVIDGVTGERATSPCVYDMDDDLQAEPPRACNAKYGDYLHIQAFDRYGEGATVPQLYLWYGQNDEWSQPLIPEQLIFIQGQDYMDSIECQPRPTRAEWQETNPEPGTYPEDCLVYDNNDPALDPGGDGMMVKVTIPPPEPSEATPTP